MSKNRNTGGSRKMKTAIKPIRPTTYEFNDPASLQQFLNYASSTEKSNTPELERVRRLMKQHQAAAERKHQ